jgi:outer membrane protein assembly factor BamE (lipoprotein component of BamABCDE complex)
MRSKRKVIEAWSSLHMKKTQLITLCAAALLGACEPTVANRGNILDLDTLTQIKPGTTTREDVATKLGTPTSISTFDEKIWYYVGRQTEQYSFLAPDITKQQAVEIDFDDQGIVTAAKKLDLSQAADADPVERSTPTYGQQNTLIRELLGDLSHPMPDLKNKGNSGQ